MNKLLNIYLKDILIIRKIYTKLYIEFMENFFYLAQFSVYDQFTSMYENEIEISVDLNVT